jgi:hypothetical protein
MKLKFFIERDAEKLPTIPRLATISPKVKWPNWFAPMFFVGFVPDEARTRLEKIPVFTLGLFKANWAGYTTQEQFITHLIQNEPSQIEVITMGNKIMVNWAKKGDGGNSPAGTCQHVSDFTPRDWDVKTIKKSVAGVTII